MSEVRPIYAKSKAMMPERFVLIYEDAEKVCGVGMEGRLSQADLLTYGAILLNRYAITVKKPLSEVLDRLANEYDHRRATLPEKKSAY